MSKRRLQSYFVTTADTEEVTTMPMCRRHALPFNLTCNLHRHLVISLGGICNSPSQMTRRLSPQRLIITCLLDSTKSHYTFASNNQLLQQFFYCTKEQAWMLYSGNKPRFLHSTPSSALENRYYRLYYSTVIHSALTLQDTMRPQNDKEK